VLSVVRGDDCETVSAAKLGLEVKLLVRASRVELGPELIVRLMRRGLVALWFVGEFESAGSGVWRIFLIVSP
jgi:hypothetical protein